MYINPKLMAYTTNQETFKFWSFSTWNWPWKGRKTGKSQPAQAAPDSARSDLHFLVKAQCARLHSLLAYVRYKPGVTFDARPEFDPLGGMTGRIVISLLVPVPMVDDPKVHGMLHSNTEWVASCLSKRSDKQVLMNIFDGIMFMERHEATEWFKYRGKCVIDPHPELKKGA